MIPLFEGHIFLVQKGINHWTIAIPDTCRVTHDLTVISPEYIDVKTNCAQCLIDMRRYADFLNTRVALGHDIIHEN